MNRVRIESESTQDVWGTSGDPPREIPPVDAPEGASKGTPNRNKHEPMITKKHRKAYYTRFPP